jgi:sarcosine oxidase
VAANSADVIVVGLGTMGAAAAWQLAERGHRVIGLDRFRPPHGRGSHAGGSRIIRLAYAEGADYVPLLRRAYEMWDALSERTGTDLIVRTGGLMLGSPETEIVSGALHSARVHGLDHEVLDAPDVRRQFPAFAPADDEIAVYEAAAGMVRPEPAITTMLDLAGLAGADLRYGVEVRAWRADDHGVVATTADGEMTAARLVLAPGAWAPGILSSIGVPLEASRRIQHFYEAPGPEFEPGAMPVWIWEYGPGLAAYGLPPVDLAPGDSDPTDAVLSGGVKAALHRVDDPVDPDVGSAPATEAEIAEMNGWLSHRLPALARSSYLGSKPCMYTLTPDEDFVIGLHPQYASVAVACGFSGHGFKFAPVVGEILADLAVSGTTSHPIEIFNPARFGS